MRELTQNEIEIIAGGCGQSDNNNNGGKKDSDKYSPTGGTIIKPGDGPSDDEDEKSDFWLDGSSGG